MDKKSIKHIANKHCRKAKKYFKHIFPDFNADSIHQFRVEYKKLRAFLRIISLSQKSSHELKVSKKLKRVYARAGYIRSLQLQYNYITRVTKDEYKAPLEYLRFLRTEVERQKPKLKKIHLQKSLKESREKIDATVPHKFTSGDARNFIQGKWSNIYTIIKSRQFNDENMHAIRKNLKDLSYDKKISEDLDTDILMYNIWKDKNEEDIEKLVDELGSFQDKVSAIALVNAQWLADLNNDNRSLLARIKRSWIRDKMSAKKMLLKKLTSGIDQRAQVNKCLIAAFLMYFF
jgi:CHAD domain-containing protein